MSSNYSFDFFDPSRAPLGRRIRIAGRWLTTTPVFFAYWRFAAERQKIFFQRLRGKSGISQTSDPILQQFKFTNAYRASDRVSQYLIRNVIYRSDLPTDFAEVFFRILLFKIFNRIETWTLLEKEIGEITLNRYRFDRFREILSNHMERGERIYSAAYIMPSAGTAFGHRMKHENHLRLIEYLLKKNFPARLIECDSMAKAYEELISAPSIGPFLAYQYVTDLNYSDALSFSESEFVVAGPGALDGIRKCFLDSADVEASDVIRYMYDNQEIHFGEQELGFLDLWGRRLQLIDCQNLFCEISKYARVAFPDYAGLSGRTRIKQKFLPKTSLPSPWYPPKWGLNEKITNGNAKS